VPVPDYTQSIGASVKGMKIGLPREYRINGINPEVDALWNKGADMLRDAGAEVIEISLPHTKYALPVYYIIAPAEASSNLSRYDGVRFGLRVPGENLNGMYENTRGEGFGKEVRRRILIGTYVLSAGYYDAYYLKAQKVRRCIRNDFDAALKNCDAILTPTSPGTAFALGEKQDDPIAMYLEDVFTVPLNLAGLPGISVPVGLAANGLPLGLQLIGRAFDEATLFKAASALEKAASFTHKPPFTA
jgi:aspartyl-tRNA(Asn)/glutamyl-tRNA(Gln) amidotransferase subunit A